VSFESPDTYSLPVPLSRTDANTNDQRYHYSFHRPPHRRHASSDHLRHSVGAIRHRGAGTLGAPDILASTRTYDDVVDNSARHTVTLYVSRDQRVM
jgi:hypothetical protein